MNLTQAQDAVMNAIVSNLETLAAGKDLIVGSPLTKADMQRIAQASYQDGIALWDEISHRPTLGFKPCPWGKNHVVMPLPGDHGECVACTSGHCPLYRVPIKRIDWNSRGE